MTSAIDARITFKDADGFVLEETTERGLISFGGRETVFTGFEFVDTSTAPNVTQASVSVEPGRVRASDAALAARITDVRMRVTERNDTWWKMSWQFTANSGEGTGGDVAATLKFVDVDGFIVDEATEYITIRPGAGETFSGFQLVDTSVASRVTSISTSIQ